MKVNIFIAKRNRNEHLRTCLHYLNLANKGKKYDVEVHVTDDDGTTPIDLLNQDNIRVFNHEILPQTKFFNKSKLFNYGLSKARSNFDWMSIVDIDMVYVPDYFEQLEKKINSGYDYIVSHGFKLNKSDSNYIIDHLPDISIISNYPKEEFTVGPSQITITKNVYQLFIDLFGSLLYDETYEGWGAEDSDISFKSIMLVLHKKIKKIDINKMWFHLWHDSTNINQDQYDRNNLYFQNTASRISKNLYSKFGRPNG